jgi:Protein of unknown function (DUF1232)
MQMSNFKSWAKALKRDAMTLCFAWKHPQTQWYARAFAFVLTVYALSPIDLIPDFRPISFFSLKTGTSWEPAWPMAGRINGWDTMPFSKWDPGSGTTASMSDWQTLKAG